MNRHFKVLTTALGVGLLLAGSSRGAGAPQGYQALAAIKPVMSCEQLAKADLGAIADAKVTVKSATVRDTEKGQYCSIMGQVEPGIGFRADLPIEHWTQRFLLNAQGRYNDFTLHAGGCTPALNGEIAVATSTGDSLGRATDPRWGIVPDGRINWAYRGNHMIAVAVKGLIRAYYGRPQKFSYMVGCSEGGRQTIEEAQRYPEDFDGLSVGAPVIYDATHNVGFWHGWEYHADRRADGSIILSAPKLKLLHAASVSRCAPTSGVIDGMLQQPTACRFDKAWVQCAPGAADTANCLTAEEADVAEQLYLGPNDGQGHFFEAGGWPAGSELNWRLSTPGKPADNEAMNPNGVHRTFMPPLSGLSTQEIVAQFQFTQDWYDKTLEMGPLMNAANTNLAPLAKRGGKLILWSGAEDTTVQPALPISYYEGVRKTLGPAMTDSFMRFFLLPGVGHCGGAEGPNQVDVFTPLMAWVETHRAPRMLVAGRVQAAANPRGQFSNPGGGNVPNPVAPPPQPTDYTRPIYPWPMVAKYSGKGDVNDAASYVSARGPAKTPQVFHAQTMKLLGPNNQKFYYAEGDELKAGPKR
jgi:feruloyl esterase